MYSVADWYWIIAGKVFSSRIMNFVEFSNKEYREFLNSGMLATEISSGLELFDVLKDHLEQPIKKLDLLIPRGLEDMWEATGFDTSTLPGVQQRRIFEKQEYRKAVSSVYTLLVSLDNT